MTRWVAAGVPPGGPIGRMDNATDLSQRPPGRQEVRLKVAVNTRALGARTACPRVCPPSGTVHADGPSALLTVSSNRTRRQDAALFGGRKRLPLPLYHVALLALLLATPQAALPAQSPGPPPAVSIRWTHDLSDTNKTVVEVSGLSAGTLQELQLSNWQQPQWQSLLSVHALPGDLLAETGLPPMLGSYSIRSGRLCFEPRFRLEPGVKYRAVFHPERLPGGRGARGGAVTAAFQASRREPNPTTVVSRVYPSAEVLPENLLKFYIHFSAPMSGGHIYDHLHLRTQAGKEIELPFLEIDEELWDPAMTRLTLFIDPGRIKRGVQPLEEIGPALEQGKRYTLFIERAWRDAAGNPLRETFQKAFAVGPPDREPPDPARWKLQPPRSETREPLAITFPEPMDHALARRLIRVARESGELIEGETGMEDQERRWRFLPTGPWGRGSYTLLVPVTIEDLAGNNVGKPFEVDLVETVQRNLAQPTVKLAFEVR